MKYVTCIAMLLLYFNIVQSQNSRFSIEENFGLIGNFFFKYHEDYAKIGASKNYFYNKEFLGTTGGMELAYNIGKKSEIIAGYSRSVNAGKKNYGNMYDDYDIAYISDFKIRHHDNIYYAGFKYTMTNHKTKLSFDIGPAFIYYSIQTIEIYRQNPIRQVVLMEANYRNANLVEGGIFIGFQLKSKLDNHFDLGLKARGYYMISTSLLDALTFTPTLTYRF